MDMFYFDDHATAVNHELNGGVFVLLWFAWIERKPPLLVLARAALFRGRNRKKR